MKPAYYEFYCPVKILCGRKALANLPHELAQRGVQRPMLVTDKGVQGAGLVKHVDQALADAGTTFAARFDEVPVDSSNRVVNRIARLFVEQGCDGLVAVGGGSVIDTAKGVNIVVSEGTDDLLKFQGVDRLTAEMRPLIIVPTTAGTGSEVTAAAVIFDEEHGEKIAPVSGKLYPAVAILDPVMTLTLPPRATAATGLDALTHAIEAMLGVQKNPVSDAFASAALRLLAANLERAVADGTDVDARMGMANGALLAGAAFSNSMVGVVHALAHALGALCDVPHGVANGICLPWGMAYNLKNVPQGAAPVLAELAVLVGAASPVDPVEARAERAIAWVFDLLARLHDACGLPTRLSQVGVREDDLPKIADLARNDGALTYNLAETTREELLGLLRQAF